MQIEMAVCTSATTLLMESTYSDDFTLCERASPSLGKWGKGAPSIELICCLWRLER